jgi:PIN domain nuclease of toxin-antitoxin system
VRLLLDAHALIWAVDDPARLGPLARSALGNPGNEVVLSAGTIWELAIKSGLGKLSLSQSYGQWMAKSVTDLGATILPITVAYADAQANLPLHHRDPFDRLLVAQAQVEKIAIVSGDTLLDRYGVPRVW